MSLNAKHGTRHMYQYHGCRCAECKAANNAAFRKQYAQSPETRKRIAERVREARRSGRRSN